MSPTLTRCTAEAPPLNLRHLGISDRVVPMPASDHLERMLGIAHATTPPTPVALSLTGPAATVPALLEVVHDGTLRKIEMALKVRYGVALCFSVSRNQMFYRSICGGHLWGRFDGMPEDVLTIFYSQHPFAHVPPFRDRREEGLIILT